MEVKIIRRNNASLHQDLEHYHPVLQRVFANRGVANRSELERSLQQLLPYEQLMGIDQAVARLTTALQQQQVILIVGDFDADGATSTAVAIRALNAFGANKLDYLVPNRFDFGYGLSPELVRYAAQEKRPQLIITVDNGIASIEGVQLANELGIDVVVTDHHLAGNQLPKAAAIVNPNQPGCPFPSKNLAGVGVIFYVMIALRAHLRRLNWFKAQQISEPNLADWLDIVALGTVADVVPLDQNNRILVYQGLERIRRGRACAGIQALLNVSQRAASRITASDLGFAIGPRLNAAGRLEDMSLGIECLITTKSDHAEQMANQLDTLNLERRSLEQDMQTQALELLAQLHLDMGALPAGLCLANPTWHQGVIGILASRIKEKVYRPVICCAYANEAELKGSCRSIPGCHIRDVLAAIANRKPYLLTKFGGHAMAAGLTLPVQHLEEFTSEFANEVAHQVDEEAFVNTVYSDGVLAETDMTMDLACLLRESGPWGQAFPEPLFDDEFRVIQHRVVGQRHLKMTLAKADVSIEAIAFNYDQDNWSETVEKINAAYRLDINEYRGNKALQLIITHMEPLVTC